MTDMAGRLDPEIPQDGYDPDLYREEQRLSDISVDQLLGLGSALDHFGNRPAERRAQCLVCLCDGLAKRRARVICVTTHARPLRGGSRNYERDLTVGHCVSR